MAEIDSRIPLMYRPVELELPSEVALRHQSLANLGQRNVLQNQIIQERMRAAQDEQIEREEARRAKELFAIPEDAIGPKERIARGYAINPAVGQMVEGIYQKRASAAVAQQDRARKLKTDYDTYVAPRFEAILRLPEDQQVEEWQRTVASLGVDHIVVGTPEFQEGYKQLPKQLPKGQISRWIEQNVPQAYAAHLARTKPDNRILAPGAMLVNANPLSAGQAPSPQVPGGQMQGPAQGSGEADPVPSSGIGRIINPPIPRSTTDTELKVRAASGDPIAIKVLKDQEESQKRVRAAGRSASSDKPLGAASFEVSIRKHDDLQRDEQNVRAETEQLWAIVSGESIEVKPGGILGSDQKQFIDPRTNKEEVLTDARLASIKDRIKRNDVRAKALADQQVSIRKRLKIGEYAEGQGSSEADYRKSPAAQAPAPAPAKNTYTEAEVRQRARASRIDENVAVADARAAKLIQ